MEDPEINAESSSKKVFNLRDTYNRAEDQLSKKAHDFKEAGSSAPRIMSVGDHSVDVSLSMSKTKKFNLIYKFKNQEDFKVVEVDSES